jgi:hypothetical protein
MPDQNPIYDFLKSNKLTDLDEKSFVSKYSAPDKAKEIHSFFVENKLTDLDSAGFYDKYLKKKVGGEKSSPTKSPSREYLSEGLELADKGFIKTEKLDPSQLVSQYKSPDISLTPKPKKDYYSSKLEKGLIFDKEGKLFAPSSEALTKEITPAEQFSLKKSTQKDLVEKSREMAVVEEETIPIEKQGWLLNTVSALDKGFYKNFISNPIKGLGTLLQGATKKVLGGTGEGFISDKLIQYGDYLNKAIDELTPQDEEFKGTLTDQVSQALGQVGSIIVTGGIAGAGKGATAALVSEAPKGAVATATKALSSQLSSPTAVSAGLSMGQAEFDRAKEAGATDDQAFEAFYKNAVTGSVLETIPVMQFFKRFNNSTGGSVANYIKTKGVAGLTGGIEEMATEVMQQIYSNKTAKDIYNINQEILDGVGSSGGIGFGVGFLLNAMGANAKILRKQGREQEATVLENQVKQYEDNLENPKVTSGNKVSAKDIVTQGVEIGTQKAVQNLDRDLANNVITPEQYQEGVVFAEKAAQVADKIPETVTGESRAKSIELLVERNDINEANQNLLQQKQTTDVAYHAGIDQEIKANEERIKKLDSEVYNIAKKPSKEFGTKTYIVDGEEVSKEAFEALQGKPLGTKTVIKAEVKPEEVKVVVTEEVKPTEVKETIKIEAPKQEYTTKTGKQKVQYEKGQLIVRDTKTGKEVSDATRKKAIDEYIDNFDFNKGERFTEVVSEMPSGLNEEEGKRFIIENTNNSLEVLETYAAEPKESKLTTEEQLIADYGLGKLTQKGFKRFGDENLITGGMALTYFNKEGTPIDVRAKEMSDYYGKEITPQDIVNFMIAYPSGASQAVRMGETRVAMEAAEKFKQLTGIDLNSKSAEKIIDAEIAKAEAFEQEIIKQEYETREQLEADYYKASTEADRLAEEGNRPTAKPAEKTEKTTEVELAKEYKEVVGKASKKAKENAKKEFVERNFDNIVEKLKIQIKCPT